MANRWWACDCCKCSPDLLQGGVGGIGASEWPTLGMFNVGEISTSCAQCHIIVVIMRFASERLARHYVGDGNYHEETIGGFPAWVTDEWVLFSDGAVTYSRDAARPMPFVIVFEEHPTIADALTPVSIDLNNGAFIWTRASDDPANQNWTRFNQTTGVELESGSGFQWCVGIRAETKAVGYVWPFGDAEDFTVQTSVSEVTDPCDALNQTFCLEYAGGETDTDGWNIIGGVWTHEEVIDVNTSTNAILSIDANTGGECVEAFLDVVTQTIAGAARLQFSWTVCSHDVRECPQASDFELVFDGACTDGSLDSISCGDCEGGGSCPPDDCLASYCKWAWNVDTQQWDLLFSSCIDPAECPDPPPTPDEPEVGWVECLCCTVPHSPGPCPGGTTACESACTWVWNAGLELWIGGGCAGGCTCYGSPTRAGLFDGETVDGICCEPEGP